MKFNKHFKLEGLHAPFSPSKSSWLRYDDDKLETFCENMRAAMRGTLLHEWVKKTIDLGIKQPESKKTLYAYVNDAIGFGMSTEVVLYYSDRFFGTADTICFRKNPETGRMILRIHDLKTGKTTVHIEQLIVYAALFCLEYKIKPEEIDIELRIYQNDKVLYHEPSAEEVGYVIDRIVHIDDYMKRIESKEG